MSASSPLPAGREDRTTRIRPVSVRCVSALAGACALAVGLAACGPGATGSGTAITGSRLTVYSSLPLQGPTGPRSQAIVNGAKLAVEEAGAKVGKYAIGYVSLDDSTPAQARADDAATSRNARKAVGDKRTIAYLGEYNSGATGVSLQILNQVGIAQVSPTSTYVGLTTNKAGSKAGEPDKYYPANKRTFARIVPPDTIQGASLARAVKDDGCKTIRIWNTKTAYSAGLARNLATSAKAGGLSVEGNDAIDPRAANYQQQAAAIKADCFVFTGEIEDNGVQALKDVALAHPKLKLYGGDGVTQNAFADPKTGLPAAIASRFKGTIATPDPGRLNPAAKRFLASYRTTYEDASPDPYAIYGYESMSLILDAITRANTTTKGKLTRESVYKALLATRNRQSVLGTYSIDANGDTSLTDYGLHKIVNGKLVFVKTLKGA